MLRLFHMNQLPRNWVEEIFRRFHGRFGNRFLSEYMTGKTSESGQDEGVENAKRVWSEELAGFTPEEIKRGLSAQYEYLPDCDKFKIACRPTIDLEQSFYEAVQQMHNRKIGKDKWSSAIIYWAAVELGNDLNNYPFQSIKARWKKAIDKAKEGITEGKFSNNVPERLIQIPAPGKTTLSKEKAEIYFKKINDLLSNKVFKGETSSEHKTI